MEIPAVLQKPMALMREGSYQKCIEELLSPDGEALRPEFSDYAHNAWYMIGDCRYQLGNFAAAVDAFLAAYDEFPGDRDTMVALGNSYSKVGDHESAIMAFGFVTLIWDEDSQARFNLGNAYLDAGQPELAIKHFERICDLQDPLYQDAKRNLEIAQKAAAAQ